MKILILNGPNLNLLGIREPAIYGRQTYEELVALLRAHAAERGITVEFFQSNHEGALVDAIQEAYFSGVDGIVCNPAAYTHTSIAIADAVRAVGIPTVEVHISDVDAREAYRRVSYLSEASVHTVKGRGFAGYVEAMDFLADRAGAGAPGVPGKTPGAGCENADFCKNSGAGAPAGAGAGNGGASSGSGKISAKDGDSPTGEETSAKGGEPFSGTGESPVPDSRTFRQNGAR